MIEPTAPPPDPIDYSEISRKYSMDLAEVCGTWQETALFKEHFSDCKDHAKEIALILENQRLVNPHLDPSFAKHSLEIVAKVFKDFIPFHMVNIQPMFGPTAHLHYLDFAYDKSNINEPSIHLGLKGKEIFAKTRILKAQFTLSDLENNIDDLATKIREDITREIISDLKNNAATIGEFVMSDTTDETIERLYCKTVEVSGVVHRKTLRGGTNWIVADPKIAQLLCSFYRLGVEDFTKMKFLGTINARWRLFLDPLYPENQMLMGCKEHLMNGYTYCPYVPLTPAILSTEDSKTKFGLLSRYGKHLSSAKPYARINVKSHDPSADKPSSSCS